MCLISFLPLTSPLRAEHHLMLLSIYISSSFLKMPFFSIFPRTTQIRLSPPSTVYATKWNPNISFGKKRKPPCLFYPNQREIRGQCGPSDKSRERKVLSSDWPRDLVGRDEWTAANLPSSPRPRQEHGKLCHLLKKAWWGLQPSTKQLQGLRAPPIGLDAKCIST